MLKLIRLEWKKNNVGKYIRNVVIMSALICLFIFALCYLGIANDPDTGVPDAVPGNSGERFKFCVNRKTDIRYVISYRGQNLFFRVLSLFVL